jgi:glycosyltransferase involved in cell wall biosynthesis
MYSTCFCLIAASYAEGFGLPLVEAAQYKLPLLVRDIPVFLEIAGKHATCFTKCTNNELAKIIKNWICSYSSNRRPKSKKIKTQNWKEASSSLLELITK